LRPSIARAGIRPVRRHGVTVGVYAMPVLPNFYASHQWLRELRRRASSPLIAVDFVIADDEVVMVGHYNSVKRELSASEAAGLIMHAEDPRGYEVVIPRALSPSEIARFRAVPQVVGWRYLPDAHGRAPCMCPICVQPGTYGAAKLRARFLDS
jgi:hypothetical protein